MPSILVGVQKGVSKKGTAYMLLHMLTIREDGSAYTEQKFVDPGMILPKDSVLTAEEVKEIFDTYKTVNYGIVEQ